MRLERFNLHSNCAHSNIFETLILRFIARVDFNFAGLTKKSVSLVVAYCVAILIKDLFLLS